MNKIKKILALCLSVIMLATCINVDLYNAMAVAITKEDELYIQLDGKKVNSVTVPQMGDKVLLTTQKYDDVNYHWQLAINGNTKEWVNISGQTHNFISLSWAMLESIVDVGGKTYIRCTVKKGDTLLVSDPVLVSVSYSAPEQTSVCNAETEQNSVLSAMVALGAVAPQALVKHTIQIDYKYEDGSKAFDSFYADVIDGGDFEYTVNFPSLVGYLPYFESATESTIVYEFNLKNVTEGVHYTVTYKPTEVEFKVKYFVQNIKDDRYEPMKGADGNEIVKTFKGLTGTQIGNYDNQITLSYTGCTMLFYDKTVEIAADGSTEIEIYYDRNYYLVYFNLDGGYGVDPVYARYGTTFSVNQPTRAGYVFSGWELATVGVNEGGTFEDRDATDTEKKTYELENTLTLPAMNLKYNAIWITTTTHYTIVYWKENADDNGYTYWGSVPVGIAADGTDSGDVTSGDRVSGKDDIPQSIHNEEKKYFTYNDAKTDKNVIVEGDGSTVVNVYYYRNVYNIYFKGISNTCAIEKHTHGTDCNSVLECTMEEHTHGDTCGGTLICTKEEHKEHTDECLKCIHEHTTDCYKLDDNRTLRSVSKPTDEGELTDVGNGIYTTTSLVSSMTRTHYYVNIGDTWYTSWDDGTKSSTSEIKINCTHEHTASCYTDELHTHTDSCYTYTCGKTEHTHTDSCYRPCTKLEHTHTSQCNINSTSNVIHVVTAKYEQNIADVWPTADKFPDITLLGWSIDDISSRVVSKRVNMTSVLCGTTEDGLKLKYAKVVTEGENKSRRVYLYYMFESFDQTSLKNGNDRKYYNGKYYDKSETYYQEVNGYGSWNQKQIDGMTVVLNGIEYDGETETITADGETVIIPIEGCKIFFYYTRNRNSINFYNYGGGDPVKTVTDVMYEQPLKEYTDSDDNLLSAFVPEYPSTLEPNAYDFAGWYTTAECFAGTEFNFDTATMPNNELALYAKWEPTKHTVNVYNKEEDIGGGTVLTSKIVPHGQLYGNIEVDPYNGGYIFNGWFYRDEKGEEKAFDFNNMPVRRDLDIYAKWSSVTPVECTLEYKYKDKDGNEVTIADKKTVIILSGESKTFDAKAGNELYEGYREHYYPKTNSHTIAASAEDESRNTFTFYYVYLESVKYTVEYRNKETKQLMPGDNNSVTYATSKTVVVEFYKQFDEYMPDAYQKKLVLSENEEENVITFWYTKDSEHAMYLIRYWTKNLDGETYTEYRDIQGPEKIETAIPVDIININGYEYKYYKITQGSGNIAGDTLPSDAKTGNPTDDELTLTKSGLIIDLYYDRVHTSYTVKYLEQGTNNQLLAPKTVDGVYGQSVTEKYVDIKGYSINSTPEVTKVLSINSADNEIIFYYTQKLVNINYVAVPPEGGDVSLPVESVQAVDGTPTGSTPTATKGWRFDGWYTDEACTQPVDASWVDANNKITPQKIDGVHVAATYYVKFVEELADLTITKDGVANSDKDLTFMFNVVGEGVDMVVAVKGNGSVVIKDLKVGNYTVTEITDWSWRYEPEGDAEQSVELVAGGSEVTFTNERKNDKWLDDEKSVDNIYENGTITQTTRGE